MQVTGVSPSAFKSVGNTCGRRSSKLCYNRLTRYDFLLVFCSYRRSRCNHCRVISHQSQQTIFSKKRQQNQKNPAEYPIGQFRLYATRLKCISLITYTTNRHRVAVFCCDIMDQPPRQTELQEGGGIYTLCLNKKHPRHFSL